MRRDCLRSFFFASWWLVGGSIPPGVIKYSLHRFAPVRTMRRAGNLSTIQRPAEVMRRLRLYDNIRHIADDPPYQLRDGTETGGMFAMRKKESAGGYIDCIIFFGSCAGALCPVRFRAARLRKRLYCVLRHSDRQAVRSTAKAVKTLYRAK